MTRRFGKIAVLLAAVFALTAFVATAAQAATGSWKVAGTTLSGEAGVSCAKAGSNNLQLTAPALGFNLTATGIECVGASIFNNGTAHSKGKLKFTGVTVMEPAGCTVASSIETKELQDEIIMGTGTETFDYFFPSEGTTFVTIKLEGCAAAGKYNVSGGVAGKSVNLTGEEAVTQTLVFNGTSTASKELKLGETATAFLSGEVANSLNGTNVGKKYSAHE